MIVADTNLFAYLYLPGDLTPAARRTLRRDSEWVSPLLWRGELCNVLAAAARSRRMKVADAQAAMEAAEAFMRGREYRVSTTAVLQVAAESGCSAYDCEFVALALDLQVPLVTADRAVLAAFPRTAVALAKFGAE